MFVRARKRKETTEKIEANLGENKDMICGNLHKFKKKYAILLHILGCHPFTIFAAKGNELYWAAGTFC